LTVVDFDHSSLLDWLLWRIDITESKLYMDRITTRLGRLWVWRSRAAVSLCSVILFITCYPDAGPGSCRISRIYFLARWHKTPLHRASVSLGLEHAFVNSFLEWLSGCLGFYVSFLVVIMCCIGSLCTIWEIDWEGHLRSDLYVSSGMLNHIQFNLLLLHL